MPCASEEIIMAEVGGHTSENDVFHDVNSILYTAYTMAVIFLKVINVFRSENLALFTVTSIHCIRKSIKKKIRNRMEPEMESKKTENSRLKHMKTERNRVDK